MKQKQKEQSLWSQEKMKCMQRKREGERSYVEKNVYSRVLVFPIRLSLALL